MNANANANGNAPGAAGLGAHFASFEDLLLERERNFNYLTLLLLLRQRLRALRDHEQAGQDEHERKQRAAPTRFPVRDLYSELKPHPSRFKAACGFEVEPFDRVFDQVQHVFELPRQLISGEAQFAVGMEPRAKRLLNKCRLFVILMWLRHGLDLLTLSILFGPSTSTLSADIRFCVPLLCEALREEISFPTAEQRAQLSDDIFGAFASLDHSSFYVNRAQRDQRLDYRRDKGRHFLNVMNVAASDGTILMLEIGVRGHRHDVWCARQSMLPLLLQPHDRLLADNAYRGFPNAIVPFRRNEVANRPERKAFNRELSRRRVTIEHSFAFLKSWKRIGRKWESSNRTLLVDSILLAGLLSNRLRRERYVAARRRRA